MVIAGEDRVAYGSLIPEEGSFGRWAQRLLNLGSRLALCGSLVNYPRLCPFTEEAVTCIATSLAFCSELELVGCNGKWVLPRG